MDINNIKVVHFVGIGGIGISAAAKLMALEGKTVSGSDISESETLDELREGGVQVFVGHSETNVPDNTDLLVYSSAVPDSNPEREAVKRKNINNVKPPSDRKNVKTLGVPRTPSVDTKIQRSLGGNTTIPQLSYFEFLGEISKTKKTIAIAGTHGKSTTTAMLGLMLEASGLDPTVITGSKVEKFSHQNLRYGKSDLLVVEACEHFKNFLHLHPQHLIINNVELDHTDFYKDLDDVEDAFVQLAQKVSAKGFVLFNNDNHGAMEVLKKLNLNKCKETRYNIETFGLSENVNWLACDISATEGEQKFKIRKSSQSIGEFNLCVPGKFNIYNALAASAMAMNLGVPSGAIKKVLSNFSGIWRRFERVGERDEAIIISDYGHHPTEIKETLKAARDFYPMRRIVLAFQPHQHNRTKDLFDDFVEALSTADLLILSDIFDVKGREESADQEINSYDLIEAIRKKHPEKDVKTLGVPRTPSVDTIIYGGNLEKTTETILKTLQPNDLLIIMGAGDIYTIIPQIVQK